jgi:DNA ligase (NAD+)
VKEFWAEEANAAVVDAILAAGVVINPHDGIDANPSTGMNADGVTHKPGYLAGMRVVVTGSVPGMTRDDANAAVVAAGGAAQKAVSGKTDLLVAGEGAGRNKAAAAEERGVRVVDAETFLKILAGEESV